MSSKIPTLSEPILGEADTRNVHSNGKRFALLSVLVGLGFLVLTRTIPLSRSEVTMAAMRPASATKLSHVKNIAPLANLPRPATNLPRPARGQARPVGVAAYTQYTPDQIEFLKRKEAETGRTATLEAPKITGLADAAKYSPEQLAFLKRKEIDYHAVREDLKRIMDDPTWDDGSLGPVMIRLGWHSSGTYSKETGTGGSEGAAMRFEYGTEAKDPENAGLLRAQEFLQPIKDKYQAMTYSDLWVLAAYVAIEHMGGPTIEFKPGRKDARNENTCPEWDGPAIDGKSSSRLPHAEYGLVEGFDKSQILDSQGRIKGWENLAQHMRDVFYRMGFNDREIVALMTGGHLWGRCHPESSGYAGPWVEAMTTWSNEYAADMLEDEWRLVTNEDTWLDEIGAEELRPAPGKRQYVNQAPPWEQDPADKPPNQMMLVADMVLAWDPEFRKTLEEYAEESPNMEDDNIALRRDFAAAYKKLTELGAESLSACPFATASNAVSNTVSNLFR